MKKHIDGSRLVVEFDNVTEYVAFARTEEKAKRAARVGSNGRSYARSGWQRCHQHYEDSWAGCTLDAAIELATGRAQWEQGLALYRRYRAQFENLSQQVQPRQTRAWGIAGGCVDVGAFLASEPEHFIRRDLDWDHTEEVTSGQVVRIVMNGAMSCSVNPDVIIRRGAALMALVDMLEQTGTRCEIVVTYAMDSTHTTDNENPKSRHQSLELVVPVKRAADALCEGTVLYWMAHPSALRWITFGAEDEFSVDERDSYGYPAQTRLTSDISLAGLRTERSPSEREMLDWVREQLKAQGVRLEETK